MAYAQNETMPCWPCCWDAGYGDPNSPTWKLTRCKPARGTGLLSTYSAKAAAFARFPFRNGRKTPLICGYRPHGKIFRAVSKTGKVWGEGLSQNVVWYVVRSCCRRAGLERIAPHDLRRTCAKLCYDSGGELEQIQFLLGHASVLTTERYLGCKQNLGRPVNDRFSLGLTAAA